MASAEYPPRFTAVKMYTVVWGVMLCSVAGLYQHFGGMYCLLQGRSFSTSYIVSQSIVS
jgi:hypothetical protein